MSHRQRSTTVGRVDTTMLLRDGARRTVRTYLPADYEWTSARYPVLYMFDGHNLFDVVTSTFEKEWQIDKTLEELQRTGRTSGAIVVGVDAPEDKFERYAEYTAWDWNWPGDPNRRIEAQGELTADFLVSTVKPHIEATYRVTSERGRTAISGSSMGGYMSIFMAARNPEIFGSVAAFSPVTLQFPMEGDRLRDYCAARLPQVPEAIRFYLDMGGDEHLDYSSHPGELVANMEEMAACLAGTGHEVLRRVIPGAVHDEQAWAARFGEVFLWLFEDHPAPEGTT